MEYKISHWDFRDKLIKFLKLRKTKEINEKTIIDFEKLLSKFSDNIKHSNGVEVSKRYILEFEMMQKVIANFKSDFIEFEDGSSYKKSNIESFSRCKNGTYNAIINRMFITISKNDFILLSYIFHNDFRYGHYF